MYELISRAWKLFANVSGVAMVSAIATVSLLELVLPREDVPVVSTSNQRLLTPRVQVGGSFTFVVDHKSSESCPGTAVVVFTSVDPPITVISGRFPLATPGYNSPPPLTITRPVLRGVTPGVWDVEVGVDSRCATRNRYDTTGRFRLEVTDAQ